MSVSRENPAYIAAVTRHMDNGLPSTEFDLRTGKFYKGTLPARSRRKLFLHLLFISMSAILAGAAEIIRASDLAIALVPFAGNIAEEVSDFWKRLQ